MTQNALELRMEDVDDAYVLVVHPSPEGVCPSPEGACPSPEGALNKAAAPAKKRRKKRRSRKTV